MSAQIVAEHSFHPSGQSQAAMSVVLETHQRLIHIMVALVAAEVLLIGGAILLSLFPEDDLPSSAVSALEVSAQPGPSTHAAQSKAVAADASQPPSSAATKAGVSIASELLNPIEDAFLSDRERKLLNDRGIK